MPKGLRNVPAPSGKVPAAGAAASAYARFIPREELGAFAAWTPGALTDTPQPANAAGVLGGVPGMPYPQQPGEAIEEDLQTRLTAARQTGYQDGYRDGLVALESFKQSFAQQMSTRIGVLLQSFDEQMLGLEQDMATAVAETALQLARQVVRDELVNDPQRIARVAQEALAALLLSAKHITIRVNPDDEPLVAAGAGESLAARGARLVSDAAITRGGCRVDSDIGAIDATVQMRWQRAVGALGADASAEGLELGE